ncbi:MAG: hypothetical protein VX152_12350, partial [Pseudomonadota bacterium]|nr:hypothetical protein [Pseudomonadota bacterium]
MGVAPVLQHTLFDAAGCLLVALLGVFVRLARGRDAIASRLLLLADPLTLADDPSAGQVFLLRLHGGNGSVVGVADGGSDRQENGMRLELRSLAGQPTAADYQRMGFVAVDAAGRTCLPGGLGPWQPPPSPPTPPAPP